MHMHSHTHTRTHTHIHTHTHTHTHTHRLLYKGKLLPVGTKIVGYARTHMAISELREKCVIKVTPLWRGKGVGRGRGMLGGEEGLEGERRVWRGRGGLGGRGDGWKEEKRVS